MTEPVIADALPNPLKDALPYGSWPSELSARLVTASGVRWGQVSLWEQSTFWEEGRPAEQGRVALLGAAGLGEPVEVVPAPYSVRSRAHEYGGGAHLVWDDTVYFCNFGDQRLYQCVAGQAPTPLGDYGNVYFADMQMDASRHRILAIREDHRLGDQDAPATLVAIALKAPYALTVLHEGHDFYASISIAPDSSRVAWLTWEHPRLPWDGTDLWCATINADGTLGPIEHVAGGPTESIAQPRFSPQGDLWFVSDRTGWWNLYRSNSRGVEPMYPMAAEFTRPQWVFGMSTYGFSGEDTVWCVYQQDGISHLASLELASGSLHDVRAPYQEINQLRVGAGYLAFEGGSPHSGKAIIRMDLKTRTFAELSKSSAPPIDPAWISAAQSISYPSTADAIAHAFYYPPHNPLCRAPVDARPPLLVMSHEGPPARVQILSTASSSFGPAAVLRWSMSTTGGAPGMGGSTGIAYWVRSVSWMSTTASMPHAILWRKGLVDEERLAIRGGSAGGFTTLSALTFHQTFKAGASYFGIGDLEGLARDTHKFESRYLDGLVGPYPAAKAIYDARSPVKHADQLSAALILFQGLQDKVVPPSQSEEMFQAVKDKGLPVAYVTYENEGHGFRSAQAQQHSLETELAFYARIFGFSTPEPGVFVKIENLPESVV